MFGLTKSRAIVFGISGIVITGALIPLANQAKAQRLIAQHPPVVPAAPATPAVPVPPPDAFNTPSQVGIPKTPSVLAPGTPARRTRRVPIDPVPMPGDVRRPIPDLPAIPDIRKLPASDAATLSGIAGTVIFTPICSVTAPSTTCQPRPYAGALKISNAAHDRVVRVTTDEQGNFRVRLAPGMYMIEPDGSNFQIGTGQTVSVISSIVREMEFNFQGTIPPQGATPTQKATPAQGAIPAR